LRSTCNEVIFGNDSRYMPETTTLCMVRKVLELDNELIAQGLSILRDRLPEGWRADADRTPESPAPWRPDAAFRITAPDRRRARLAVEAKSRLEPRDALLIVAASASSLERQPLLVIAPFLSRATRERLLEAGVNWLDLTANIRLILKEPGLYIQTDGASKRPSGSNRPARSLKGTTAGRVVRSLLAAPLPIGVVDLAKRARTDAGYVSRLFDLLDEAALIERGERGRVQRVERVRLVRRWAEDAPLQSRGNVRMFLEPRGIANLLRTLKGSDLRYAITGSLAAQRWAAVASPRHAQIYVDTDALRATTTLGLLPAEAGANVQLISPKDRTILANATLASDGLRYAMPSQVAVDLLTSPGRGPAEADALLDWMATREETWRAGP
jgi:hypothetical protein